jgi:hypothetical protein
METLTKNVYQQHQFAFFAWPIQTGHISPVPKTRPVALPAQTSELESPATQQGAMFVAAASLNAMNTI